MLTDKGNQVLQTIFNSFRDGYIYRNPGCNENDVERAFLNDVLDECFYFNGTTGHLNNDEFDRAQKRKVELKTMIEEIQ